MHIAGDWFNRDVQEIMEEFLASGGDPEVSDSFLINGQPGDLHPCSKQGGFPFANFSAKQLVPHQLCLLID